MCGQEEQTYPEQRTWTCFALYVSLDYSKHLRSCLDFKLSPCSLCSVFSFGYFPGVWGLKADVSEPSIFLGRWRKMARKVEPIEGSETSAFKTQTPGKYPKENILLTKLFFLAYGISTSPCSRHSLFADCCVHGYELFCSIKVEEFRELMSNYYLLCKDLSNVSSVRGAEQTDHSQGNPRE